MPKLEDPNQSSELFQDSELRQRVSGYSKERSYDLEKPTTFTQAIEYIEDPKIFEGEADLPREEEWLKDKKREEYISAIGMVLNEEGYEPGEIVSIQETLREEEYEEAKHQILGRGEQ